MKNTIIIRIFLCLALVQLVVPLSMIAKREMVLKSGIQFKFKVAPVDPYDAFRGRYVALRVDEDYVPVNANSEVKYGQTVFALISVDSEGFAKLAGIVTSRPKEKSYLQAKGGYTYNNKIYINLPISRYYMEEKAAPLAEKIYQRYSQADKKDAYVVVRIKDGLVVIENLYVGGQKIEDMVRQEMKNPGSFGLREAR